MQITKCDICGKKIENEDKINIYYKLSFPISEICLKCGKPIEAFLKKNKLIKPNE